MMVGLEQRLLSRKIIFVFLFLATFAVYGNTFLNDWTYDDRPVVIENPDIRSLDNFFKDEYKNRPLRELSYMLDYMVFGENPAGYHLQQLLWHAANGCLVYLLLIGLGVSPLYGLLGTCLFLFHPIQVESVANIGHRKELLPLFFGILMLFSYIKSFSVTGWQRGLLWVSSLACYGLVLAGNVTAGTFPLLLPLYEWLFLEKKQRLILRRPLLFWLVLLAAIAACGYYYVRNFNFDILLGSMYVQNGFVETKAYYPMFLAALKLPMLYLGKLLWPIQLAPEYIINFSQDWLQWASLAGTLLVLGLLTIAWFCRKNQPQFTFAIAWCFILYLPVSNFLPVHAYPMADRYMYMILPGVSLALAMALQRISQDKVNVFAAALLLVLVGMTVIQNTYWRNDVALWSRAVQVNPNAKGALWSYGQILIRSGNLAEAKVMLNKVLAIDRFSVHAYLELAKIFEREGNLEKAKEYYELFVRYGQFVAPKEAMRVQNYLRIKFP